MSHTVRISNQALGLVNSVAIDGHALGKEADTAGINAAYARLHGSKTDLCEYISRLEWLLDIPQRELVKR